MLPAYVDASLLLLLLLLLLILLLLKLLPLQLLESVRVTGLCST
jgi:hypothetical protein